MATWQRERRRQQHTHPWHRTISTYILYTVCPLGINTYPACVSGQVSPPPARAVTRSFRSVEVLDFINDRQRNRAISACMYMGGRCCQL